MIQNWAPDIRVSIESGLLQRVEAKAIGRKVDILVCSEQAVEVAKRH